MTIGILNICFKIILTTRKFKNNYKQLTFWKSVLSFGNDSFYSCTVNVPQTKFRFRSPGNFA